MSVLCAMSMLPVCDVCYECYLCVMCATSVLPVCDVCYECYLLVCAVCYECVVTCVLRILTME